VRIKKEAWRKSGIPERSLLRQEIVHPFSLFKLGIVISMRKIVLSIDFAEKKRTSSEVEKEKSGEILLCLLSLRFSATKKILLVMHTCLNLSGWR